jgi:phosphate transport system substrate-binding protein
MNKNRIIIFICIGFILFSCKSGLTGEQNREIPQAQALENIGSDTMVNLALAWAEAYQAVHPDLLISVTGGGSGTGIAALINGTADIANASRAIKDEEITTANENGIDPVQFTVARDAIAVIVNPQNPIGELTLEEVSDIYSGKIINWAELGGENRPIVRLSRETNSGTHVYFLEEVLRLGDKNNKTLFSRDTLLLPSSEGITTEVRDNPNAIGYDGLGYVTEDVKVLAIAAAGTENYIFPSYETVNNNRYPIARDLFMYTAGEPKGNIKQFIEWIFSDEAQGIVLDLGFIPVR